MLSERERIREYNIETNVKHNITHCNTCVHQTLQQEQHCINIGTVSLSNCKFYTLLAIILNLQMATGNDRESER